MSLSRAASCTEEKPSHFKTQELNTEHLPKINGGSLRHLVAGAAALCGVQLQQQQHEDPQEVGGAQRRQQLAEDRQPPVLGHVRQRVGEHVHDPRHHGDHDGGGRAVREAVGLQGGRNQRHVKTRFFVPAGGRRGSPLKLTELTRTKAGTTVCIVFSITLKL